MLIEFSSCINYTRETKFKIGGRLNVLKDTLYFLPQGQMNL